MINLAKKVRNYRKRIKMTQKQLADQCGVSDYTISVVERHHDPSRLQTKTLQKLSIGMNDTSINRANFPWTPKEKQTSTQPILKSINAADNAIKESSNGKMTWEELLEKVESVGSELRAKRMEVNTLQVELDRIVRAYDAGR